MVGQQERSILGNIQGKNTGKSLSTSLVNIFSPTITNEVVVAAGGPVFGNTLQNPSGVNPTKIGFGPKVIYPIKDGIAPNIVLGDAFGTSIYQLGRTP